MNIFSNWFVFARIRGNQRYVVRIKKCCKIFEQIVIVVYLHVIPFSMNKGDTVTEVYLEPKRRYMMKSFRQNS